MASAMCSCSGSLGPLQSDRSWSWSHLKGVLAHMTGHDAGRRLRSPQGLSPSHLHGPLRVVRASSQHGSWVPRVRVPRGWSGSKTIASAVVTSLPRSAWRKQTSSLDGRIIGGHMGWETLMQPSWKMPSATLPPREEFPEGRLRLACQA